MTKNVLKYESYREAWRRIGLANASGFHFEAVTICESIISDRLLSYLHGVGSKATLRQNASFSQLIAAWRQVAPDMPSYRDTDLGEAVDQWRRERNAVVHSLAKSLPGTPTAPLQEFLDRVRVAAATGADLANEVSKWHKQQLAAHKASSQE